MNLSRKVIISTLVWASSAIAMSATIKDLPVRTINGKVYHYYEVPAKETVYSICYKFGITKEQLLKENPAVADGLKSGMTLYFPMEQEQPADNATSATVSRKIISHKVEKGETIFGIARKYGVTTDEITNWNPALREGLKAGQTITIKTDTAGDTPVKPAASRPTPSQQNAYIVKKKETFYSIAHEHGITVAQLEAANPGVTSLKAGQVLNIPGNAKPGNEDCASKQQELPPHETATTTDENPALPKPEETTDEGNATPDSGKPAVNIAVVLPFMLKEETPSKGALRCTEFYKGMLIAADSLRHSSSPIHIKAFDTEGSTLTVKELTASPEFKDINVVVAPDNAEQLAVLGEWGKANNVKILNSFLVRNDSYLTNPDMMQGNLPSNLMIGKAIEGMAERLRYSTPVFLSLNGSTPDKADFVNALKKSLDAKGITYMDVSFDGRLMPANLKALPADGSYTFIPLSGKQADLNKMMPGIIEWRDEAVTPTVKMFGYPEWITYRGETLDNMHKLNTTVYSRFYSDDDNDRTRDIEHKFHRWYGRNMEAAVPRQGLLGFDTGMFLIRNLAEGTEKYDGVQNGFRFINASPDSGSYNDVLYFINFRPGGITEKNIL